MNERVPTTDTNRREILNLSGLGVLGGVAVGALAAPTVRADAAIAIPFASWIHGHSMHFEYPDRITNERRTGFSIAFDGKSGTSNWLHFAIPTPVIINDVRMRASSVMLRFKTGSVDAFVRDVHVYDGEKLIAAHNGVGLSKDHLFERFVIPDTPQVQWGLGISIGVGFGVESMSHHMEFIAAGCDFVINKAP
jgi:hypothetical protein